jgi:hypothetical protein
MADTLEPLRKELERRKDECFSLKEAHNRAAEAFGRRNNRLTLTALIFSALTGTSAIWSAIEATFSAPLPLALWGTSLTGLVTTIVAGAQKTPWGGAEEAKSHQGAAAGYDAIARDALRDLAETPAQAKRLIAGLADVDLRMGQIRSSEPFLPEKFLAKAEPASIQLNKLRDVGLVDVFMARDSPSLLNRRFRSKPRKVQILETWTGYESQLDTWITQAVNDGAAVQILLLAPTSEHVKYRAQALSATGVTAHYIKNLIEEDLRKLGSVLGKLDQDSSYTGTLEVRVYDLTPVVNMYRFDEVRIVGMYLWGEDSIMGPQFEVNEVKAIAGSERTPLAKDFDAHFEKIWNHTGKNPTKQVTFEKGKLVTRPLKEEEKETITET